MNGLSIDDLARYLFVSKEKLYRTVNGIDRPSCDLLKGLGSMFSVEPSFFSSRPFIDGQCIDTAEIDFNGRGRHLIKARYAESVFLRYLDFFVSYLEGSVIPPDDEIEPLVKIAHPYAPYRCTGHRIESMADHARQYLGIGSNDHILADLEDSGAYVVDRHSVRCRSYSTWTEDSIRKPIIVLGDAIRSATGRTFELVRQLGDLIMHRDVDWEMQDRRSIKAFDHQNDLFAIGFLMPKRMFTRDVIKVADRSDPMSYLSVKRKYRVPLRAIARACRLYGLISKDDQQRFDTALRIHERASLEPLDDEIVPFKPSRLKNLLGIALSDDIVRHQFLSEFRIDYDFILKLFGLEAGRKPSINLHRIFKMVQWHTEHRS